MSGIAFVTAKKIVNSVEKNAFYIGTIIEDGFIYFSDERRYRYEPVTNSVQILYETKNNWIETNNIYDVNSINIDLANIASIIGGLVNGNGSIASSLAVENAVQWAIEIANDDSHGYDQAYRTGPDYDCSSLICHAFNQAGFNVSATNSTYTMKDDFQNAGFTWITDIQNDPSKLKRGDILLYIGNINAGTGHTAMYIGNGSIVEASCNEFGGIIGGQTGDQTGQEIWCHEYYSSSNWDGVLRYGI